MLSSAFRVRKQLSKVKLSSYGHLSHKVVLLEAHVYAYSG